MLDKLKLYYDMATNYVKRTIDNTNIEYCKGYLFATYNAIKEMLLNIEQLPKLEPITQEDLNSFSFEQGLDLVYKINIFNNWYPIYLDDYGQSYGIFVDNSYYSFGTYNLDIEFSAVSQVLSCIYRKDTIDLFKTYIKED